MKFKHRIVFLVVSFVAGILYLNFYYNKNGDVPVDFINKQNNAANKTVGNSCYMVNEPETDLSSFQMLKDASVALWEDHKTKTSGELFPDINALKTKSSKDPLTVFVIPHSHNDPAWLKTFDDYYSDQTSKILANILTYLNKYKNMTFLWTETVFLNRWWPELSEKDRNLFINFLKEGRLEIAGGGWVAADEATTTIHGLIENLIQGHSWLAENLPGVKMPKTWWNLDPFGYSSIGAYVASKAGYQQSTILRVHSYVKDIMQKQQQLEFNWTPTWLPANFGKKFSTFTSILPFLLYNIKYSCGPHPQVCLKFDFRAIPGEMSESLAQPINEYNLHYLSEMLHQELRYRAQMFKHNVVMFLLGDDFRYDRETEWEQQYENFQKLFHFMNNHADWNVKIRFGTPSDYFDEVNKLVRSQEVTFPTLKGDFFTYYDRDWAFWSGYFTSRPYFKWLARKLGHDLRTAELLTSLNFIRQLGKSAHTNRDVYGSLESARQMYTFFHHHDSITGTSASFVTRKYLDDLTEAIAKTHKVIATTLPRLIKTEGPQGEFTVVDVTFKPDGLAITLPASDKILLYLLNSVSQSRSDCVTFQVHSAKLYTSLYNDDGSLQPLPCQISPAFENGRISEKLFDATVCLNVKAWSARPLILTNRASSSSVSHAECKLAGLSSSRRYLPSMWSARLLKPSDGLIDLTGARLRARFDPNSGLMKEAALSPQSPFMRVVMKLQYYNSHGGSYLFMPDEQAPALDDLFERPILYVVRGSLVSYVRVEENAYTHTVRLYNVADPGCHLNDVFVIENLVNLQTQFKNFEGKELFLRVDTQLNSKDIFYTDSNGVFLTKRKKLTTLPLQGNYYPITGSLLIEDSNMRMNLMTNHAHGVTSRFSGSIEVMLQRSATINDDRGNSEALSFDHPAVSRMFLYFEQRTRKQTETVFLSQAASLYSRFLNHPITSLIRNDQPALVEAVSLAADLSVPCNVEILNLRWNPTADHVLAVIRNSANTDCEAESLSSNRAWGKICTKRLSNNLSFRKDIVFPSTGVKSVYLSNLSGVKKLANLKEPNLEFDMVPGDFYSFILKF